MEAVKIADLSGGINNLANVDRMPAKHARDLLNLDPAPGGGLTQRCSKVRALALSAVTGGIPSHDGFLIVDGGSVKRFNTQTGELRGLIAIPGATGIVGAVLGSETIAAVGGQLFRYRDNQLHRADLQPVQPHIFVSAGRLPAGIYRVAVTAVDSLGIEYGTQSAVFGLSEGSAVQVEWSNPAGADHCRLYMSTCNGEVLYLQRDKAASPQSIDLVADDTARLEVDGLDCPMQPSVMAAYKGRMAYAAGHVLQLSKPYAPHLVDLIADCYLYAAPITVIAPTDGGIFVCTETETHFLSGAGTTDASTRRVLSIGAVKGSCVPLRDGAVAWMTERGQAIGRADGTVGLPQERTYAPGMPVHAAAGVIEAAGVEVIATAPKGVIKNSRIGVVDAFDMEIVNAP